MKKNRGILYYLSCCILMALALPVMYSGSVRASEGIDVVQDQTWIKRLYYRGDDELVSEKERTYDENGSLLKESIHFAAGVPAGSYIEYEIDESGQRTAGTVFSEDGTATGESAVYEYDEAGRLSGMVHTDQNGETQTAEYQYDEHGNLISRKVVLENGSTLQDEQIENEYDDEDVLIKSTSICNRKDGETESAFTQISEYQYDETGKLVKVLLSDEDGNSNGYYEFVY